MAKTRYYGPENLYALLFQFFGEFFASHERITGLS